MTPSPSLEGKVPEAYFEFAIPRFSPEMTLTASLRTKRLCL
jgi:hypothetical protein